MLGLGHAEHRVDNERLAYGKRVCQGSEFAWLENNCGAQEVTVFLGREKSERRAEIDGPGGYRNGYGKLRKLALSCGTWSSQGRGVRGVEERFESRLLPLFVRGTETVAELLPTLYLHGLSMGDFELALRGLLGDGRKCDEHSRTKAQSG